MCDVRSLAPAPSEEEELHRSQRQSESAVFITQSILFNTFNKTACWVKHPRQLDSELNSHTIDYWLLTIVKKQIYEGVRNHVNTSRSIQWLDIQMSARVNVYVCVFLIRSESELWADFLICIMKLLLKHV